MHRKYVMLAIVLLAGLLLPPEFVHAQTATPPREDLGVVTGAIANGSPGGSVPDEVELMLHIWDRNYQGQGMLHAQSTPDGSFRFSDVEFKPDYLYAVMANYQGATYFSEIKSPSAGQTELTFDLPIYESRSDLSQVQIDQARVIFYFDEGTLQVTEAYILSNGGKYTVKNAVTLDDGQPATLKFNLPQEANLVSFETNRGSRFIQFQGGFADTAPLVPGGRSGQVVANYEVSYEKGWAYSFSPPVFTETVNFLIVQDPGVSVEGEGLQAEGARTMKDGTTFDVYSYPGVQAVERVDLSISGQPERISSEEDSGTPDGGRILNTGRTELAVGLFVLGLALVGTSFWYWRRVRSSVGDDQVVG